MSSPRVSVVIPTYERADLVCEAIDSVLRQSVNGIEIIVVDDGSTDHTESALRAYGERLRYLRQENAGVNAARNRGLAQARGEFVALLDNDDLWAPYKIELQVALLEHFADVGFVFSNFYIFQGERPRIGGDTRVDGLGTWLESVSDKIEPYVQRWRYSSLNLANPSGLPRDDFEVSRGDIYASSLICPYVLPSTALIRRSAIPPDLQFPEFDSTCGDWEFFARLSQRRGSLYIDLETAFNRSHEDAVRLTRVDSAVQLKRRIAMIDRLWRADAVFRDRHTERLDSIQRGLLVKLAQVHLLASRKREARTSLQRAASLRGAAPSRRERWLNFLAQLPGSGFALRVLHTAMQAARGLRTGRAARP